MAGPVPYAGSGEYERKRRKNKKKSASSKKGGIFGGIASAGGGDPLSALRDNRGSIAELIERQAAAQKRAADQKAAAKMGDPFQMLQDQLYSSLNGGGGGYALTPIEELRKTADAQVSAQYDPQIAALGGEINSHKKRGAASEKEARKMYGAMSQDFLSQLPELTNQFAQEDAATNQRYDAAQAQMDDEYQKQSAQQNAVLKQLGIAAAAPDASQQAMEDQAYFANQGKLDQQQAMNALDLQQSGQMQYQRDLGNNAKMAGENTAQDIHSQLSDYLTQAGSQMTGLVGGKQSAIAALLGQMQQQDQQNAAAQQQQQFENQLALFNFQLDATKAQQDAASKGGIMGGIAGGATGTGGSSLFKGTTGLSGASNYLAEQYPNQPILASHLMENINNVLANKNVVNGKFVLDPGNESLGQAPKYSDVGQEYMMDLLRRQFEKNGGGQYSTGDINQTMNALLAYMGKLR